MLAVLCGGKNVAQGSFPCNEGYLRLSIEAIGGMFVVLKVVVRLNFLGVSSVGVRLAINVSLHVVVELREEIDGGSGLLH